MLNNRYDSLFLFYGAERWIWLKAQAMAESGLDPNAVNIGSGCRGLTQFADATFAEVAGKLALVHPSIWNPEHAIVAQAFYMKQLCQVFGGSWDKALAAYNWGMGNLTKLIAQRGEQWAEGLPAETREYGIKIGRFVARMILENPKSERGKQW